MSGKFIKINAAKVNFTTKTNMYLAEFNPLFLKVYF